jgi:pyrroline-5-carboxylate reductase
VIAILGAGKMGEALISGLLRAGRSPSDVVVVGRRPTRAAQLRETYGVEAASAADAVKGADTLVIAVKPQDMSMLLDEIAPHVPPTGWRRPRRGHSHRPDRAQAGRGARGQVMSNTPVHADEAMSVISATAMPGGTSAPCGGTGGPVAVLRIPNPQQDAATALSGSGPAYVFFLVEAMVDARILLGIPRATALEMVNQAVYGAATMLRDTGEHPVILREAVTSPGGTTISAIRELERHGVRAAFLAAIESARDRGAELGSG